MTSVGSSSTSSAEAAAEVAAATAAWLEDLRLEEVRRFNAEREETFMAAIRNAEKNLAAEAALELVLMTLLPPKPAAGAFLTEDDRSLVRAMRVSKLWRDLLMTDQPNAGSGMRKHIEFIRRVRCNMIARLMEDRKEFVKMRGGYCVMCLEVFSEPQDHHLLPTTLWQRCAKCYGGRRHPLELSDEYLYYADLVQKLKDARGPDGVPSPEQIEKANAERIRCLGAEGYAHHFTRTAPEARTVNGAGISDADRRSLLADTDMAARERRWGDLSDDDRRAAREVQERCERREASRRACEHEYWDEVRAGRERAAREMAANSR